MGTLVNINLMAPICSSGYGLVSLEILKALRGLGHNVALFPIGPTEVPEPDKAAVSEALAMARTWDAKAPSLRIYHQFALAEHVLTSGPKVAFPIFELDTLTSVERYHLNQQDLVFVASEWARKVLEENGIRPRIEVVPFGVNQEIFHERPLPSCSETVFLHCAKLEYRKGVYDVLDGFDRAFTKDCQARLILHVHNPFARADLIEPVWQEFLGLLERHPLASKIELTRGRFQTQQEVAQLMVGAHCGLFPSRAEGWNLELSEMLAMGRHCIATNYSGHTEFVSPSYCRLIEIDSLESAYDGVYFFGQGRWAKLREPQMRDLVSHMRDVHSLRSSGQLPLNEVGIAAMKLFGWEKTAAKIMRVLA